MAKHRVPSIEFKRQVAQDYLGGETLHGLAQRHDICRNLIRVWVRKYEAGEFDEDAAAADLLRQYEARIAALERLVGKQALELEFLKGALNQRTAEEKRAYVRNRRPDGLSVAEGCRACNCDPICPCAGNGRPVAQIVRVHDGDGARLRRDGDRFGDDSRIE